MKYLDLLDAELKSDVLCDFFETYDVQVVYEYDRTHEGLADEYLADLPDLGMQFVFDDKQIFRTLFMRPIEISGFNPFDANDDQVPKYVSKPEALQHARDVGVQYSEGTAAFMGEEKDWIRFEYEGYSIHYEFVDSELRMITIQARAA